MSYLLQKNFGECVPMTDKFVTIFSSSEYFSLKIFLIVGGMINLPVRFEKPIHDQLGVIFVLRLGPFGSEDRGSEASN